MGVFCSRVRMEEKKLFSAFRAQGIPFERVDVRRQIFSLNGKNPTERFDVVLIRCLSHTRSLYVAKMLEHHGMRVVNGHQCIAICGDKVLTTMALRENKIPTPRTIMTFSLESSLMAMEAMGYPVVIKPAVGSWGRLMAKVNDRESAEAVLEHKLALGHDFPYYIQEFVEKPGRDIRALVVGEETVYAVYRQSQHWITNTARGGETTLCPITPEIDRISLAAARAVKGEIVAVDLLETAAGELLVNEVNHTPEFHGASKVAEGDIASTIIKYIKEVREIDRGRTL